MDTRSKNSVLRWWRSMMLSSFRLEELNIYAAPAAHKAQLKRCQSADSAMLTDGFRALWLSLDNDITNKTDGNIIEAWATIAVALAQVKVDSNLKLAQAAGMKGPGGNSVVSELRFSQLQNSKNPQDLLRRLRRIIQQVKGEVNVVNLADNIHQWFSEHHQLRPRKADKRISVQWAMDYYQSSSRTNSPTEI